MTVLLIPEHAASRIVTIQTLLSTHDLTPAQREALSHEQAALWDEAFPGRAYEDIARLCGPFLLTLAA